MYNNILHKRLHTCTIILNTINYTLDYERVTVTIILTVTVQVKFDSTCISCTHRKCNSQCKGNIIILINYQINKTKYITEIIRGKILMNIHTHKIYINLYKIELHSTEWDDTHMCKVLPGKTWHEGMVHQVMCFKRIQP